MRGLRGALPLVRELDPTLAAAWRRLAAEALEPNPFAAPALARAAADALPAAHADRLLVVCDGDRLVLALPVRPRRRYRRAPVRTLLACGHQHAFLDTPLVDPATDPVAAAACALQTAAGSGGWLMFERLPADGPVRAALDAAITRRGARTRVLTADARPMVHRRDEATYLEGRLSTQRRKALRKARRRLEAELGPLSVRDLAGDGVEPLLALERAGWKGRAGTALASVPGDERFFRAAMGAAAREQAVQGWVLEAGGRPVAALSAVIDGRGAFHLKTAYDETLARVSPGLQLEVAVLEAFHEDPRLDWIDSCAIEDGPSALLYPDRRRIEALLVVLGGPVASAAAAAVAQVAARRAQPPA